MIIPGILASSKTGNLWKPSQDYVSISTATVDSSGSSSVSFTSIPTTFQHLQVRGICKDGAGNGILLRFNNSSATDYAFHSLGGDGATATATGFATQTYIYQGYSGYSGTTIPSTVVIDILDYTSINKNKTTKTLFGEDHNGAGNIIFYSGLWKPATIAAINRIDILNNGGTFAQYSQFSLYGVK